MDTVPDGYARLDRKSPFMEPVGPIFQKTDGRIFSLGVRVAERHTNARGLVHGGLISTLADLAMGYSMALVDEPPRSGVTASLTTDIYGAAAIGDWLEVRAHAKRVGGKLAFCACDVLADDTPIAQGTAVFRVTR
ncbi:MAG: PaaI family thioesterase [Alphaproteobacteria bacterium]|nr:PaaI family thioesterase [Alphaproteobacteria bacterium]